MSAPIRRFWGVCCDANPSSLSSNSKLSLRRQAPNTLVPTSNCYYTWLALLPPTRSHAANHSPSSPTPSLPANLPSRTPHISPPPPPSPLHSFPLTQNVFCRLPLHPPLPVLPIPSGHPHVSSIFHLLPVLLSKECLAIARYRS